MSEETAKADKTEEDEAQDADQEQTEGEVDDENQESTENANEDRSDGQEAASAPEFAELNPSDVPAAAADLNRLNDVKVVVAAELGRTKVSIEDLLHLNVGSIFELNRSIDSPVELVAQGVPLGNGEVVVVDGSFAIRIQEIYSPHN